MTQRTLAGLLAVPLVVALWFLALREPLPYVVYSPGLTIDTLGTTQGQGEGDGKPIISVSGAKAYHDDTGQLRLTTVLVTQPDSNVRLFELVGAWLDRDDAVYPYDAVYGPQETDASQEQQGAFQMANSQDSAIGVALTELGYDVPKSPVVSTVEPDSPAAGKLQLGDLLLTVNGRDVTTIQQAARAVDATPDGAATDFTVLRGGEEKQLSIKRADLGGDHLRVGITMTETFVASKFPVDVTVRLNPDIGGPSAGLMFSLAIYDTLTKGSLTEGDVVAGTGTIQADGSVGPIGGIDQKIAAARGDGAQLFLVPTDNCRDAADAPNGDMELVRVTTMSQAVDSIETWAQDHDARLPSCDAEEASR